MTTLLVLSLFFTATFALAGVAIWLTRHALDRASATDEQPDLDAVLDEAPLLLRDDELSTISPLANLLQRFDFVDGIQNAINEADLGWSVGRVTFLMLLCGAVAFAVSGWIVWLPLWIRFAAGMGAMFIPYAYILQRRTARLDKIVDQFPEAIDTMARAMRAGHPFAAAIDTAGNNSPNPLGKELRKTFAEGALGMPWDQALDNLSKRVPIAEVSIFAASVQIQSRSGGNLGEVFDKLSENMREGAAIRGEVRSYSNQGRLAGTILTILPVAIAMILFTVNPGFLKPLFEEGIGRLLLMGAIAGPVAAHFVIRKLVDIRL